MKKMIFLLVIIVLLAACQPAPTPCPPAPPPPTAPPAPTPLPAETETLADSISQVIGIWYMQPGYFMEIKGTGSATDLKFWLYQSGDATPWVNRAKGTMSFENGKLSWLTFEGDCQDAQQATYEIYIVEHEGRVIGMRPKAVGEDGCLNRRVYINKQLLEYVGPLFFTGR